jgi:hypothetical protein
MSRPFGHAAYKREASDSVLLRVALAGAPEICGIGECAPRVYVTGENAASVAYRCAQLDLSEYLPVFGARDVCDALGRFAAIMPAVETRVVEQSNLCCLLELAIFDLLCHVHRRTCVEALRDCISVLQLNEKFIAQNDIEELSVSVVIDSAAAQPQIPEAQPPVVKVKVSNDLDDNLERVRAVRARCGDGIKLVVDANMSWSYDSAILHINALSPFNVFLFEEPLIPRQYSLLRELRRVTGAKLMLDESLVTHADAVAAVEGEACDAFNIRVSKCGGLLPSMRLIEFALTNSILYQIGVQVAEVGPLINASRALGFLYGRHFTIEAGQSDRFFDQFVVSPGPVVDRVTNKIVRPTGYGFGMALNENASAYAIERSVVAPTLV